MPYTIGHVIYGLPTNEDEIRKLLKIEGPFQDDEDDELPYFPGLEFLYISGGMPYGYIGVKIGEFDETAPLNVASIPTEATNEQREAAAYAIQTFEKATGITSQLEVTEPGVYVVWGTS